MKKIICFLILFLLPVFLDATTPATLTEASFILKDSYGNYVNNAGFTVHDINNNISFKVEKDTEKNGIYKYDLTNEVQYDMAYGLLNDNQKNIINNIKTVNDSDTFENKYYSGTYNNFDEFIAPYKDTYGVTPHVIDGNQEGYDYVISFYIPVFMILEETTTPSGLSKETMVSPGLIVLRHSYKDGSIKKKEARVDFYSYIFKYDDKVDYSDVYATFIDIKNKINSNVDDIVYYTDCGKAPNKFSEDYLITTNNSGASESETSCLNETLIVLEKGNVDINIESFIDGEKNININEKKTLKYKTILKNNGNSPSYNNTIISVIPKSITYVNDSVNNNGIFDKENNTITWNINYLDALSGVVLEYEIEASNVDNEIIKTSFKSDEVSEVNSNNLFITLDKLENPKTSDSSVSSIIAALCLSLLVFLFVNRKSNLLID